MARTTIDLDPMVLAAARARARARGTTIGRVVSELAHAGLLADQTTPAPSERGPRGLVLAPRVPGHVITDEMVADAELD